MKKCKKMVELIAIGDELLSGARENTNGVWLAKELALLGLTPDLISIVPDEEAKLSAALLLAESRAEIVIATGGLGPTLDDVTNKVARALFGAPKFLPNRHGTADGLYYKRSPCSFFFLPGPPHEMKPLFEESVSPLLDVGQKRSVKKIVFFLLPEVEIDPYLRRFQEKYPELTCGIYPSVGLVEVRLSVSAGAESVLEAASSELMNAFPKESATFDEPTFEEALFERLKRRNLTIALAESMTGGALAARMTKRAGASLFFQGSAVVYSNRSKSALLGVDPFLIAEKGAVSEEVACKMAEGALRQFESDIAFSITGIAGPSGGAKEKPVGTIFFAQARKGDETRYWKFLEATCIRFSRDQLIEGASLFILGKLWQALDEK